MTSRRITTLASCAGLVLLGAASLAAKPAAVKWPPWLSIESPVNPFDPATRGAVLLVHAITREGPPAVSALTGSAEGIVNGARRTIPLRLDTTPVPGVFAVRRQWPAEGTWLLRVSMQNTTALVSLAGDGRVEGVRVPTQHASGVDLPRAVSDKEIDSTLSAAARR
ncbi:MAG TPA: hypothetical protein VKP00_06690 [Gemmatimonadaceae bacterium]|nr:hypothetical protein [Gemmatimonadaceae bacterium]